MHLSKACSDSLMVECLGFEPKFSVRLNLTAGPVTPPKENHQIWNDKKFFILGLPEPAQSLWIVKRKTLWRKPEQIPSPPKLRHNLLGASTKRFSACLLSCAVRFLLQLNSSKLMKSAKWSYLWISLSYESVASSESEGYLWVTGPAFTFVLTRGNSSPSRNLTKNGCSFLVSIVTSRQKDTPRITAMSITS